MNNLALSLNSIYKSYGRGSDNALEVLCGVSLDIKAGEVVGLIAPSGAGKSTLLHISGLLDVPDKGTIEMNGQPVHNAPDRLRTHLRRTEIGFVYQFHHLLPEFTAQENVMLPQLANGKSSRQAAERADELLSRVGLIDRTRHRPAELSGGEQQRVALCRALANKPKFILADEPTGNLDPTTAKHVFDTLLELVRATGLSALIATHNLELVSRMDRILQLDNGTVSPPSMQQFQEFDSPIQD